MLVNTGSTPWHTFALVAPAGVTFVGGTTGNEASAACTVGPPSEIACGPIGTNVMPPQARIAFIATMAAPATCGVTFQLLVDGIPADDVTASAGCAPHAVVPPRLRLTGHTVHASAPTWSPAPDAVRYQWQRCTGSMCRAIAGATRLTLVLKRPATVRVVATATFGGTIVRVVSQREKIAVWRSLNATA